MPKIVSVFWLIKKNEPSLSEFENCNNIEDNDKPFLEEDQESNNDNYDYIYNPCLHNAISTN